MKARERTMISLGKLKTVLFLGAFIQEGKFSFFQLV
jgi:hypothetical protein